MKWYPIIEIATRFCPTYLYFAYPNYTTDNHFYKSTTFDCLYIGKILCELLVPVGFLLLYLQLGDKTNTYVTCLKAVCSSVSRNVLFKGGNSQAATNVDDKNSGSGKIASDEIQHKNNAPSSYTSSSSRSITSKSSLENPLISSSIVIDDNNVSSSAGGENANSESDVDLFTTLDNNSLVNYIQEENQVLQNKIHHNADNLLSI